MKASHHEERRSSTWIEEEMQKISLVVSLLALGLMVSGFLLFDWGEAHSIPGSPAIPISDLLGSPMQSPQTVLMSLGIILLGLIPALRLLLAFGIYFYSKEPVNAVVGLVVLLELILSIRLGA